MRWQMKVKHKERWEKEEGEGWTRGRKSGMKRGDEGESCERARYEEREGEREREGRFPKGVMEEGGGGAAGLELQHTHTLYSLIRLH